MIGFLLAGGAGGWLAAALLGARLIGRGIELAELRAATVELTPAAAQCPTVQIAAYRPLTIDGRPVDVPTVQIPRLRPDGTQWHRQ